MFRSISLLFPACRDGAPPACVSKYRGGAGRGLFRNCSSSYFLCFFHTKLATVELPCASPCVEKSLKNCCKITSVKILKQFLNFMTQISRVLLTGKVKFFDFYKQTGISGNIFNTLPIGNYIFFCSYFFLDKNVIGYLLFGLRQYIGNCQPSICH